MLETTIKFSPKNSFLIPATLLFALSAGVLDQIDNLPPTAPWMEPETIRVTPRSFTYRADGEFTKNGVPTDAPLKTVLMTSTVVIMKYQVTTGEYQRCVASGKCLAPESRVIDRNFPQTGVNYMDARAYAAWLSKVTGDTWRLPTDQELAFAAGSKFPDDALGIETDAKNPAIRWLADYEREAELKRDRAPQLMPTGYFGVSEYGLADFGGNVWEWTSTCYSRVKLSNSPRPLDVEDICGIYVTAGPHRSPMSDFIRDPKGGGCSVGTPPDNLGFRLVKIDTWLGRVTRWLRGNEIA